MLPKGAMERSETILRRAQERSANSQPSWKSRFLLRFPHWRYSPRRSVPPCLGGLTGRPASCGLCLENSKRSASPSDPVEARTSKSPWNRAKVAIPVTSERPAMRPPSLAWDRPNSKHRHRSRSLGLAARDTRPGLRPEACAGGAHDGHRDGLPETRAAAGRGVAADRGPEPGCSECAAKMSKERGRYSALEEVAWACLPG